jgi:hypothetical protein
VDGFTHNGVRALLLRLKFPRHLGHFDIRIFRLGAFRRDEFMRLLLKVCRFTESQQ